MHANGLERGSLTQQEQLEGKETSKLVTLSTHTQL